MGPSRLVDKTCVVVEVNTSRRATIVYLGSKLSLQSLSTTALVLVRDLVQLGFLWAEEVEGKSWAVVCPM